MTAGVPELDHFRPKHNAIGVDGKVDEDHYWWLAYEWSNLYPTCAVCNRAKATRFPVDGRRAKLGASAKELWKERRLLLDPCVDDPELHLVFSEDGHVASATQQGLTTIEVLALDRAGLVLARERAARVLRLEFDAIAAVDPPRRRAAAEAMLGPHAEYAAMRRQLVAKWLEAAPAAPAELHEQLPDTAKVSELERELTREVFDASQQEQSDYSVAVPGADEYYRTTRFIERVEIENFRPIQELSLELGADLDDGRTPWLMLLGENGSGKSSVLQAVVLALAGESYRRKLELYPARFLRRGTQSGSVTVHLTGVPDPIELSFSKGDRRFRGQPKEPKVLLLGYGATRLLPRPAPRRRPRSRSRTC